MDGYPRPGDYKPTSEEERAAISSFLAATKTIADRWSAKLVNAVPGTKLIDLPSAGHYVFLTRETEVVHGIRDFLSRLPDSR
jgi:hypothetical protein